jgi:ElaB/YqjD/DUF883 family membrane-anchored ribosome-binding protein
MEPSQYINTVSPLQVLANKYVDDSSIKKAFNDTFHLISEVVVQYDNPNDAKRSLTSIKSQIEEAVKKLKQQINTIHFQTTEALERCDNYGNL